MTPARVHVKNKAQADRLIRMAGQGSTARLAKDPTSDIMKALQVAAGLALDLAGVTGKDRRVLISPEFNRHCLKAARALAQKLRTK